MMAIWEKFGTSGNGTGVGSSVGVDTTSVAETTVGVNVGRGSGATGDEGKGVDSAGAGWQAEARKEARTVIHNMRLINFMSVSFFPDYKSKIQMH
jgi:hypothetical protein